MKYLVVAAVVVLAFLAGAQAGDRSAAKEWEARAMAATDSSRVAMAAVAEATAAADSAEARADAALARADSLGRRTPERVVEVREVEVPAYAVPFVAPRDSIIDDLLAENTALRVAEMERKAEVVSLRVALGRATASIASLQAVLDDRPRPAPWWRPSVGLGAFVGVCDNGRGCKGLGLTASWRIALP